MRRRQLAPAPTAPVLMVGTRSDALLAGAGDGLDHHFGTAHATPQIESGDGDPCAQAPDHFVQQTRVPRRCDPRNVHDVPTTLCERQRPPFTVGLRQSRRFSAPPQGAFETIT